jgi:hypothetical protein
MNLIHFDFSAEVVVRKLAIPIFFALLLIVSVFGAIRIARGQGISGPDGLVVVRSETQGENTRQILAPADQPAAQQPDLGFIDSPTVVCYQPDPAQDSCFINWYYMSVNASPNNMVAMTVTINTIGPVARMGGFFQTSMYVPHDMLGEGFKVACGALGEGGDPGVGKAYSWTIYARDSAALKSTNSGTVYCPAYTP